MKQILRLLLCLGLVFGLVQSSAHAQQGAAQSKDYWVSYLPSLDNKAPIWLLAATNVPSTRVRVTYLEDNSFDEFTISPNQPKEYRIKINSQGATPYLMAKPDVAEVVQKRSVHVEATHPISLQGFTDADNNVGLFLILPTSNLGQKYTISAYNDQHPRMSEGSSIGGWEPAAFPRTGGGFIIVGVEDKTDVKIKVTTPTFGGRKAGEEWSVVLDKGETYWVRGAGESEDDDLSRSKVRSSKPVAVFAGCEIARTLDAMVLQNHFDYNDYIVEQMIPEEIWGLEYVSGPMTNKRGFKEDDLWGDYYRVYASEPTELFMDHSSRGISDYWEFGLVTEPRIFQADKPIMVVQYDYYIDFHGINPKNPRTANNEMVLVPRHNWRKNATFTVPTGYEQTYFHVVAHKDSIDKIMCSVNGGVMQPITGRQDKGTKVWNVDDYRIRTLMLSERGQVLVEGPCDFAVYNYGTRDNDQIKATYSYASAAAASFGSISKAVPPRMVMDSTCTEFNLKFFTTSEDARGIGDIFLLHDPKGLIYKDKNGKGFDSKNAKIDIEEFGLGEDTVYAKVTVIDPLQDAFAAVYVLNRAGKDTVYTFTYHGVHVDVQPKLQEMKNVLVFDKECKTFTFKNTGKGDVEIKGLKFDKQGSGATPFTANSTPALPVTLKPNESFTITACFNPQDTGVWHDDTLQIVTACFTADIAPVRGIGKVPIIFAEDKDYKVVTVGDSKCENIKIMNESFDKELVLTKDILKGNNEFHIDPSELARFPITLKPREHTLVIICYRPENEGRDTAYVVWGRDIPVPYSDTNRKEWSVLIGSAQMAGVQIAGLNDTIICGGERVLSTLLLNTGSGPANIQSVKLEGTDVGEFSIVKVGNLASGSWANSFPLAAAQQMEVQVRFTPSSTPSPWRLHTIDLIVKQDGEMDTATFTVDMRRPVVESPALLNLGRVAIGQSQRQDIEIENTGNYDFVVKSFGFQTGTEYALVSGIAVGDVIPVNGKITVVVEATPPASGTFTDRFEVVGETCGETGTNLTIMAPLFEVSALGADIPTTWTCQQDGNQVSFTNGSNDDVLLKGVEMLRASASAIAAQQITFANQPVGQVVNGINITFNGGAHAIPAGTTMTFPVTFDASIVGPAQVPVQFTYVDTAGISQTLEVMVTAAGKNYPVDLVIESRDYRAENDIEVEVPIRVAQSDLFNAEVYGYEFDLTFNEDNFTVRDIQEGNGHIPVQWNEVGKSMINGINYVTIHVRAHDGTRLQNDENILARMILASRLTTEDTTSLIPTNFRLLGQNGSPVCWTPETQLGEAYLYDPLCGDRTLAGYLANGVSFLQQSSIAPNPVKSSATFDFDLMANNVAVTIELFDATGNKISTVVESKVMNAGKHSVQIDATTIPSGTYYLRTTAGNSWTTTQKVTVSK